MTDTKWFTDSRFGMFVHIGLYSVPGGIWRGMKIRHPYSEWLQASAHVPRQEYRTLAAKFELKEFDADTWIRDAKNAGMKYFVITAKHHDGFALWPSRVSRFNVRDASPCRHDIIGELCDACRLHGLKFGLYYSHWQDWEGVGGDVDETYMVNDEYRHPSQSEFEGYWQGKCLPQIEELINNYEPDLLWFDSWGTHAPQYITEHRQAELIGVVRKFSNKCLVNSRICYSAPSPDIDFISMMDNEYPSAEFHKPWETSGTLNESWAYHRLDFAWKPLSQLLHNLINNAAFGGNYQLNVGPTSDGSFQSAAIKRLRDIGAWLNINGDAIYGTTSSPFPKNSWGFSTMRIEQDGAKMIYLFLKNFTPGTALFIKEIVTAPKAASVLESGQPLKFTSSSVGLWLELPKELAGVELPVIMLDFPRI